MIIITAEMSLGNGPWIVENPSLERYMSARFKQGSVKHRSRLRSGLKGRLILPTMKFAFMQYDRCLGVFLGV